MREGPGNNTLSKLSSQEQDVLIAFLSNLKPGNVEVDFDGLAATLGLNTRTAAHEAWAKVQKSLFGNAKPSPVLGPGPIAKSKAVTEKGCTSFASPTVVLVFWQGKYKISFHKDILLESPYFKKLDCLASDQQNQLEFDFPQYPKFAGEQLVRWLYYEELLYDIHEIAQLKGQDATLARSQIFNAYRLATRLEMEKWANHLTDLFAAFYLEEVRLTAVYHELTVIGENVDGMKRLVMTMAALLVRTHGVHSDTCGTVNALADEVKKDGSFALDLMEHMCILGQRSLEDIMKADKCAWHTHTRTEKCT
ncbi:uncharacterized protein PV07_07974 [Cladophialophora immunda]|uniref:Uncharacterized protein n=1 Tax=Cladophialophora immunda TaxID=569365 RepID=A0A0D2CB66_9EURO|nr:uncharacterized protein PV07_07974 [Cladophialophora immunda]KIW28298.1 hypothetical protein PV07_07974 [Cladophialophora immunda]OQV08058.1 hypothetical protein CLAIMM_12384 [Cladophialophora immunda]